MIHSKRVLLRASLAVLASLTAVPAWASEDPTPADGRKDDILVVAQRRKQTIDNSPATQASIDADRIATTVNAANVEDAVKYLPSLIVRKRHIGDTQAPLATRTGGLGASARSLIYADGALLSALIGNNNSTASPRWSLVSPQEIARIDVLYGPFSAAYPGNSIGAVVNITTRLPDEFEATMTAGVSAQTFALYGYRDVYPAYQLGATVGDRFGPLAVFASYDHVTSTGQPLGYVTGSPGAGVTGAVPGRTRTGAATNILGASGIERQGQDRLKLKAALDLSKDVRLTYVGGMFLNRTTAGLDTFLTDPATARPAYTSGFSSGIYTATARHWSHSVSLAGSGKAFDWQVIATRYRFAHDELRGPTAPLPTGFAGGAGNVTLLDGTGWDTLDAKGAWRSRTNVLSGGAHWDQFRLASNRYTTSDWIAGSLGALNQQSLGRTRTAALWLQDAWTMVPAVTLTIGGRYESWRAYDGVNFSSAPSISAIQPARSAAKFSPKASLDWRPAKGWSVRASFGEAWRFPTVGELYQVVTTPVPAVPNPNLRPERAQSEGIAIERTGAKGFVRLSLFNEIVRDALISQTGPLNGGPTLATFVQNIDRTRARGVELAFARTDIVPRFDLSGSATYADATTRADSAFPAAIGKRLPTVPEWKATLVATWRPVDGVSLTAAARYASRMYGQIDNGDAVGNTYQGFYKYFVADLRAQFVVGKNYTLGIGVDNIGNDRYFLFHPFPQRTFHADLTIKL